MVEATLPTFGAVLVTAAVDSINPCAIGVILLLVATLIKQDRKRDILKVGGIYVATVYLTYFFAGLGILHFLVGLPVQLANYITTGVAMLVIAGGLLEIKDFFWYGKGTSLMIPEEYAEKIADKMDSLTLLSAIGLGIFVAAVELPCTGGPYLAILTVLSQQGINLTAYGLMALYNLIFVMPLILIVAASYLGSYKVSEMKEWKHMNKAKMRLGAGLLMIFLGWILLLLATGIVRFG
ncbi:cytochrome c biogenesis CcdA family protein [Candidatus Nanohalococcus occultus]|uniref:Cytochrome c biogenesis protein n=1 Tax=Candidatus Nanohalococcus occultus TaxID=2978047 RepID=A0ABY8CD09_9ARCH|nr:Cytochrome c biogenesis protein [Candidatus Nanohaloarchaeota archaeon SVXNc]